MLKHLKYPKVGIGSKVRASADNFYEYDLFLLRRKHCRVLSWKKFALVGECGPVGSWCKKVFMVSFRAQKSCLLDKYYSDCQQPSMIHTYSKFNGISICITLW